MPKRDANYMATQRQRILDAVEKCYSDVGFDKATMEQIAETAGISVGTLYIHFGSRDELFAAYVAACAVESNDTIESADRAGLLEMFTPHPKSLSAAHVRRQVSALLAVIDSESDGDSKAEYNRVNREIQTSLTRRIQDLQMNGELHLECTPQAIAATIGCISIGAWLLSSVYGHIDPEDLERNVGEVLEKLLLKNAE